MRSQALTRAGAALALGLLTLAAPASALFDDCGAISANPGGRQDPALFGAGFEQRLVAALNDFELVPGLAIAVVADDRVVCARGFGYTDLDTCSLDTTDTGFYLLSTTKSITGMTAAVLQESGDFEVDRSLAHLNDWTAIPSFPTWFLWI